MFRKILDLGEWWKFTVLFANTNKILKIAEIGNVLTKPQRTLLEIGPMVERGEEAASALN